MKLVDGGICAVKGVKAAAIKEGKNGLAIIEGEGNAAGVFTRNKIIAPPLILTKEKIIRTNKISALIVNSGNANAFTGYQGMEDAKEMAHIVHRYLGYSEDNIAVSSTGIIGKKMDMEFIRRQAAVVVNKLENSKKSSHDVADAITTTDTFKKEIAVELSSGARIGGLAKGSGMIEPNMGTMLAFIYTDADINSATLDTCLKKAVDKSFNMITVDGDTSTNDMVLLISTGKAIVNPNIEEFQKGLDCILTGLAKMIAIDGEGATKLIEARIINASSEKDAKLAAKSIVRSMLVKAALFGEDPNWGRIIAAVGYSGCDLIENKISLSFSSGENIINLVENGNIISLDNIEQEKLKAVMSEEHIFINVNLNNGKYKATAWGCDLSYDYVKINAEYTT
ncbi:bifunctional ornithine acetyltransferase/N-acetylglutamate synthase [Methanosalsum natronophilum]|uniref:bifunctional ornithine acetyltransferase/N-acetylglutamate synthase n=1 Tax=Methanosalsum natronophilum TaxID=768733 RepID=UPI0021674502|nr:bifunctional ornithine acetyltransferase/N-acetylglutamate synthase [Methanosalsum natronophilum]MCS3924147.1 glutamate N-acetyltransferase/amino-acid N-acetyltransferase [Methanosalsum natronophilum]